MGKKKPETGGVSADLSFDAKKVQDGSAMFATKRVPGQHGRQEPKVDPNVGAMNATYGGPSRSGRPLFGPNGPGAASKRAGKDLAVGPVWERQS